MAAFFSSASDAFKFFDIGKKTAIRLDQALSCFSFLINNDPQCSQYDIYNLIN